MTNVIRWICCLDQLFGSLRELYIFLIRRLYIKPLCSYRMDIERYQIENNINSIYFEFVSKGNKGSIVKVIKYTKINHDPLVYNLGFGDKNLSIDTIDDIAISNNGDTERVLATVAFTIYAFYEEYPDANVYLSGSTASRTRLYQINIAKFYDLISRDFVIYGELVTGFERFQKGVNYNGFFIIKK